MVECTHALQVAIPPFLEQLMEQNPPILVKTNAPLTKMAIEVENYCQLIDNSNALEDGVVIGGEVVLQSSRKLVK